MWGLFLVILHLLPGSVFPVIPSIFDLLTPDKVVHVGMFAVLVFLLIQGFRKDGNPVLVRKSPVLAAIISALLFGGVMEFTQNYLIPNRFGSVYDEIANLAGCLVGWGVWRWTYGRKRPSSS